MDVFQDDKGDEVHVWPPCYLASTLAWLYWREATRDKLGMPFSEGLYAMQDFLKELATAKDESGEQWGAPCRAAVTLRMLQSDLLQRNDTELEDIPPMPAELSQLVPPAVFAAPGRSRGCQFGGCIVNDSWTGTMTLAEWLEVGVSHEFTLFPSLKSGTTAFLLQPGLDRFYEFDFFIVVTKDGKLDDVWAYQCRRGAEAPPEETGTEGMPFDLSAASNSFPLPSPAPSGSGLLGELRRRLQSAFAPPPASPVTMKCVYLRKRSDDKGETRVIVGKGRGIKWIVPSQSDLQLLSGSSLAATCPFDLLSEPLDTWIRREEGLDGR
ncbi:unnamed protein product [Vitrella brassicaformis CCMP3155]|uniref:Uncharacterized protein n=1 Tax=Vitrella brassicaformis (strain CCMP3155) TaxID=1169540 RepID=A0A0G4GPE7_VITBC|nr:unnamed protein product [Vitrella brassicaformis CCMP3155]|eukprot:CEM32230.1 unnamed protein product [Vitrella brassicaformis CCMP3155]